MASNKILHILYSGQGGLGSYFMNFVSQDLENRFQHYAFFYGIEPLYNEYENFCIKRGISFTYFKKTKKVDFSAFRNLDAFVKKHGIGCVVYHTFSMTPSIFLMRNIRVVAIDHTSALVKTKLEWMYTYLLFKFSDVFVSFYEGQLAPLKRKLEFLPGRTAKKLIIPKTINTSEFLPSIHAPKVDRAVRVGMSGRIIHGKRYDILLQAVSVLSAQNVPIVCSIAGSGPDEATMKALAGALGITDCVAFLGLRTRDEMISFYQSLDFYIHATEGETICYSIMEAQACGLPVVASNVEGVNNVIHDEQTGILFNTHDELVRCIRRLIEDESLRNKLSINARNLAVENFEKYKSVEMLYKEIKALDEHRS